jgi:hypothetical protein
MVGILSRLAADPAMPAEPRRELTDYLQTRVLGRSTIIATSQMIGDLGDEIAAYGLLSKLPAERMKRRLAILSAFYPVTEALPFGAMYRFLRDIVA